MGVTSSAVPWYEAGMLIGRRRANPAHFVNLTVCELVVRMATHDGWEWYGVESAGEEVLL